ncbi:MAG TPA: hypothetical protein VGK47_14935 [Nitrososphaeraceae archaeon]
MGRPQSVIDWNKVDELLVKGSSGAQIASQIGIHPQTLYEHTLSEKGIPFSDYSAQKYAKGDSLLLTKQFDVAMKGNVSMLIWLGKQRLKQHETINQEHGIFFKEIDPTDRNTDTTQVSMPALPGPGLDSAQIGD